MSTSGSYTYNQTLLQIVTTALQLINVYDLTSSIRIEDLNFSTTLLNLMLKAWEGNPGINLWKRRQATLFTQLNQYSYQLGNVSGADNVTNSYISTTTSVATGSGVSAITLTSVTGLSNGMNIGLQQDDGTRLWGTISNIASNVATCSFTTTTTAASGNTVVAYTTKINRPLLILRATLLDLLNNNTETTMMELGYDEYFNLPVKNLPGRPTNWYYDRILNNSVSYTGTLYMFPSPSPVSTIINFTYQDSIQDMLNNNNTLDFPQEWQECIVYNLAARLCRPYGKYQELQELKPVADQMLAQINEFDSDTASLKILPDSNQDRPVL